LYFYRERLHHPLFGTPRPRDPRIFVRRITAAEVGDLDIAASNRRRHQQSVVIADGAI
jgi:hypothetical protein